MKIKYNYTIKNSKLLKKLIEGNFEGVVDISAIDINVLHPIFMGSNITDLKLPGSITKIKSEALRNCSKLKFLRFNGTKAQWSNIEKGVLWNSGTSIVLVNCTDGLAAAQEES